MWRGGVTESLCVWFHAIPLSCSHPGQLIHIFVPISASSMIQYKSFTVTLCTWEGNVLAVHYRLQWFDQLWTQGLWKGDDHPRYAPVEYDTLTLYLGR